MTEGKGIINKIIDFFDNKLKKKSEETKCCCCSSESNDKEEGKTECCSG